MARKVVSVVTVRTKRLRSAFAAVGVATASAFFLFVDAGGTVSGGISLAALLPIGFWSAPFALYAVAVRTPVVIAAGGLLLNVASALLLVQVFSSESSTAALGVVFLPLLLSLGVTGGIVVDHLLRWRSGMHRDGSGVPHVG